VPQRQDGSICFLGTSQNCDLIPPAIPSTNFYLFHNGSDIIILFCRLSITYDSFIPSAIGHWNNIDTTSLWNVDSKGKFKTDLRDKKYI
jgi:hypothetical protein